MDSSNPAGGDDFVNICFAPAENGINEAQNKDKLKDFYSQWVDKGTLQPILHLLCAFSTLCHLNIYYSLWTA